MKRKIVLIASLIFAMCCIFAISVNAECATGCTDNWIVDIGEDGYLGNIKANNVCPVCNTVTESETIPKMFCTLGYSYNPNGGIIQSYSVDRKAVARYEELTKEKVEFGAVAATRNHISGNPLDESGNPLDKVKVADFTDTEYDVFEVMVNGIPEEYMQTTGIICCAYIIAGNEITYIDNGVEKINASANTFASVVDIYENGAVESAQVNSYRIINGTKYKMLSFEDLNLRKYAFWNSAGGTNLNTTLNNTSIKFCATRTFTKDELPNGTIIWVGSGWQYRPDGWADGKSNSATEKDEEGYRPTTVSKTVVVVDDAWWRELDTRGFNISKTSGSIPSDITTEDIYDIFRIYVPVSKVTETVVPPLMGDIEVSFDPTVDKEKQDWASDGALKILTIGNSFSDDSMEYVYQIAENLGVEEIVLGNLYIGGCSLSTHLSNAKNDSAAYTYRLNKDGTWNSTSGYKISTAVASDDWDFISFQQVSGSSGDADTYDDLASLIKIVEPQNPSARLVWHMTWAYEGDSEHGDFEKYENDQMTMYNAIVDAVKTKILTNSDIEIVIPAGTAIQNARTSYIGDTLTRDGYHLSKDLGRFIAGVTFVHKLTGLSIDNLSYAPTGVDASELLVAIESAKNAVNAPYEVTDSSYLESGSTGGGSTDGDNTGDSSEIDLTGYYLLTFDEMEIVYASFYNSDTSTERNINAGNAFNQGYISTKKFTKDELPVGSVIVIKEGYIYRPERWTSAGKNNGRLDNVSTEMVVVDESWWDGYEYRAFNISTLGHDDKNSIPINGLTEEEVCEIFKIYIPNADSGETEGGETEGGGSESGGSESGGTEGDGTEDSEVPDYLEGLVLVDNLDLIKYAYYHSADGYFEPLTGYKTSANNHAKFFCTRLFSKEQLPVGSVIVLESGWAYRADRWNENKESVSRPDPVETSVVIIDETWWGNGYYRGFNISRADNGYVTEYTEKDVLQAFKIYVPEAAVKLNAPGLEPQPDNPAYPEKYEFINEQGLVKSEAVTGDVVEINGKQYKALSMEALGLIKPGYYNSHNSLSVVGDNKNFATTVLFEKDELLNGFVIWCADNWKYRPDAWTNDTTKMSTRPSEVTAEYVEVTSDWWGDYSIRAFNIGKGSDLSSLTLEDIYEVFKIYVPIELIAE